MSWKANLLLLLFVIIIIIFVIIMIMCVGDPFHADNRMGLKGTLHRISAIPGWECDWRHIPHWAPHARSVCCHLVPDGKIISMWLSLLLLTIYSFAACLVLSG